jgi:hypothetical protein
MNFQPVDNAHSPEVTITCNNCHDKVSSRNAFADLDGEPFKAYYCYSCTRKLEYVERSKPFQSVEDIRRVSEHLGSHFFEPATMRFFRSRIASWDVWANRYFVTSEQFVDSNGIAAARKYTVREITPTGSIETAEGFTFQQFDTVGQAKKAIQAHLAQAA